MMFVVVMTLAIPYGFRETTPSPNCYVPPACMPPLPACNRAYIPPHREHTAWSCHGNASSWLKNMLLSLGGGGGGGGGEHWRLVKNEHTEHNRLTREPVNRY